MWKTVFRAAGLALAAGVVFTGCKGKSAAPPSTSAAPPAPESATVAPAAAPGAALSNANIADLVNEVNVADSATAAMALPKLTNKAAKDFAQEMMVQHHQLHQAGLKVQQEQNITPQAPPTDPFKPAVEAEQKALSALTPGAAYDSTYIAHEIAIHQAVLDWASQPQNQPTNPAYQAYMKQAGDVVKQHLDKAQAVQKELSSSKR